LVRSVQYAGLLLPPQPASAISVPAATVATAVRIAARPLRRVDMSTLFLSSMASSYAAARGSASAKKVEITQPPPFIGEKDDLRGRATE
jgi:hypothetical protein